MEPDYSRDARRAHGQFIVAYQSAYQGEVVDADKVINLISAVLAAPKGDSVHRKRDALFKTAGLDNLHTQTQYDLFRKVVVATQIMRQELDMQNAATGGNLTLRLHPQGATPNDPFDQQVHAERQEVMDDFVIKQNGIEWLKLSDEDKFKRGFLVRHEVSEVAYNAADRKRDSYERGDNGKFYQIKFSPEYLEAVVGLSNQVDFWTHEHGTTLKGASGGQIAGSATILVPPSLPKSYSVATISWPEIGKQGGGAHAGGHKFYDADETVFAQRLIKALKPTGLFFGYALPKQFVRPGVKRPNRSLVMEPFPSGGL